MSAECHSGEETLDLGTTCLKCELKQNTSASHFRLPSGNRKLPVEHLSEVVALAGLLIVARDSCWLSAAVSPA